MKTQTCCRGNASLEALICLPIRKRSSTRSVDFKQVASTVLSRQALAVNFVAVSKLPVIRGAGIEYFRESNSCPSLYWTVGSTGGIWLWRKEKILETHK